MNIFNYIQKLLYLNDDSCVEKLIEIFFFFNYPTRIVLRKNDTIRTGIL